MSADPAPQGCLFCRIGAVPAADRENLVLARGVHALLLLNRYPYTSGHLMVAPFRHTADFLSLSADEAADIHSLLRLGLAAVAATYRPEGYNLGANLGSVAGAGIGDHLHHHIVPRWGGDTNFMTTIADVRVLPEDLDVSWSRLREAVDALLREELP